MSFPPVISRLDWSWQNTVLWTRVFHRDGYRGTRNTSTIRSPGRGTTGNQCAIGSHPESTTADAVQSEQRWYFQMRINALRFSAGTRQRRRHHSRVFREAPGGNEFVYNKGLGWVGETEMGWNFSRAARWPGKDTLRPHRMGSRLERQEQQQLRVSCYSHWELRQWQREEVFRRSEVKCLWAGTTV